MFRETRYNYGDDSLALGWHPVAGLEAEQYATAIGRRVGAA